MDQKSLPQEYYTWESLGTLAIAAGAVIVVSNTVRTLLKFDSPWIPFITSVGLTVFGAYSANRLDTAADWVISLLNSCLLFCTATGANQTLVAAKPTPVGVQRPYGRRPVKWLSSWL